MKVRLLLALLGLVSVAQAAAVRVEIKGDTMLRDKKPYFINGAGGTSRLEELKAAGGNSFRTWSPDALGTLLPAAEKLDLTVSVGIWLENDENGFYSNKANCDRQADRVRSAVMRYKNHPAILAWGLGNESEKDGKNPAYWEQINRLAKMVKDIDPNHPTYTALIGISKQKLENIDKYAPDLDYIGINFYGGFPAIRNILAQGKWNRPWVVTEYGPLGPWERPKTSWGAALEPNSSEKAAWLEDNYKKIIKPDGGCLGGYAFLWGQKQEGTYTWFGLFTLQGERIASVDVLQKFWSGKAPANRAPDVKQLVCAIGQKSIGVGETFTARMQASDPDGDPLTYRWEVTPERGKGQGVNHGDPIVEPLPGCVPSGSKTAEVKLTAPKQPGNYRIFAYALDGKGNVATINVPFQVK